MLDVRHADQLGDELPYFSPTTIAAATYSRADNNRDVSTVGVRAILMTSVSVPEHVVYAITKAVYTRRVSLSERHPSFSDFGETTMLQGLSAPLHTGAKKFYEEIGLHP